MGCVASTRVMTRRLSPVRMVIWFASSGLSVGWPSARRAKVRFTVSPWGSVDGEVVDDLDAKCLEVGAGLLDGHGGFEIGRAACRESAEGGGGTWRRGRGSRGEGRGGAS